MREERTRLFRGSIICIGDAKLDVVMGHNPEVIAMLSAAGVSPGNSRVNAENLAEVHAAFLATIRSGEGKIFPGGVSGNVLAQYSGLGGEAEGLFLSGDDAFGRAYRASMLKARVALLLDPVEGETSTIIGVVPNESGERYMAFCPGTCVSHLKPELLTDDAVKGAGALLFEGYLFFENGQENGRAILSRMEQICEESGIPLILMACSDAVVEKNHSSFTAILSGSTPFILFANENEAAALAKGSGLSPAEYIQSQFESRAGEETAIAFITQGTGPTLIITKDRIVEVPVERIFTEDKIVNTAGAGDAFAAGALRGMNVGLSLEECVTIGHALAAAVIQQPGARLEQPRNQLPQNLREVISERGV